MMVKSNRYLLSALLFLGWSTAELPAQAVAPDKASADHLRPGDVIRLWIWREPDMSGEFPVPEKGVVVFPKIGARPVTGMPQEALKDTLLSEYGRYLRNPSIEITFLMRISILGAVQRPNVYSVDQTITVATAIALAGGSLPHGKPDHVELIRNGEKLVARITQQTRISELPIQSGDQLYVPERSWAARNVGIIAALMSTALSLTVAVLAK